MNKVVHFEIPVDNLDRAKKFYSLIDWQLQDWPMPDGTVYVGCRTTETDPTTYNNSHIRKLVKFIYWPFRNKP